MITFNYNHNGKTVNAQVEHYKEGEYSRFLITLPDLSLIVVPAGIRDSAGRLIWVQFVRQAEFVQPHDFIQAIGEGLEKGGFYS